MIEGAKPESRLEMDTRMMFGSTIDEDGNVAITFNEERFRMIAEQTVQQAEALAAAGGAAVIVVNGREVARVGG